MSTILTERTEEQERVRNGAAFLDEHRPGWRDEIDADRIDISSQCNCVLGQLSGGFMEGWREFGLNYDRIIRYGFEGDSHEEYARLDDAWKDEVRNAA